MLWTTSQNGHAFYLGLNILTTHYLIPPSAWFHFKLYTEDFHHQLNLISDAWRTTSPILGCCNAITSFNSYNWPCKELNIEWNNTQIKIITIFILMKMISFWSYCYHMAKAPFLTTNILNLANGILDPSKFYNILAPLPINFNSLLSQKSTRSSTSHFSNFISMI